MAVSSVNNASSAALTVQDEFFSSVGNGNQQKVEQLLANGADINAVSEEGTALHIAVEKANRVMVECLLKLGADPNIPKKIKTVETEEWCEGILEGGQLEKEYHQEGRETPLWEAVTKKCDAIAELLLKTRASPRIMPLCTDSLHYRYAGVPSSVGLAGLAISRGAVNLTQLILNKLNINSLSVYDASELLKEAIFSDDDNGVEFVLESFPRFYLPDQIENILKEEKVGITQKILAKCKAKNNDEKFLIALVLKKFKEAEDSLKDIDDIINICRSGISVFELIDLFVEQNELPDSFFNGLQEIINTSFGGERSTILIEVVERGDSYLVERILEYGADPDHEDNNGMAALDYAARELNHDLAQILYNYGADLEGAIEFAENEIEPSREVISLLKSLFGSVTKACLP